MIPRLWECEEPSWWESALGAPLSIYAVGALIVAAAVLNLLHLRVGRVANGLLAAITLAMMALASVGLVAGVLLRLFGANPSMAYEVVRAWWLSAGWPLVCVTIWGRRSDLASSSPVGARPPSVGAFSVGLAVTGVLLLAFRLLQGLSPAASSVIGGFATPLVDQATTWLQTDACLAAHRLEYSSLGDNWRQFGEAADHELWRRRADPSVYGFALRSYRLKVKGGELPQPQTLRAAECATCPYVRTELQAWIQDAGQSDQSRELADEALTEMQEAPQEGSSRGYRSYPSPISPRR